MVEENLVTSVEETAQTAEPEESVTSEPIEEDTEPQEIEDTPPARKKSAQERIDEVIYRQREAERERDYWREQALQGAHQKEPSQPQEPQGYVDLPEPQEDDPKYQTYGEWVKDHHKWSQQVAHRQWQEEQRQHQFFQRRDTWRAKAEAKYPDLAEVFRPDLPVTREMGEIIMDMGDTGADVAYYLGKNPHELFRLSQMDPRRQALELGRLESKLSVPPQKTKTNAPSPTSPVGGKEVPAKKMEDMSYEEFKAMREKQLYGR